MTGMAEVSEMLISNAWGIVSTVFQVTRLHAKKGQTLPFSSLDFSFTVDKQKNGSPEACG
jgi:hypothetical protein